MRGASHAAQQVAATAVSESPEFVSIEWPGSAEPAGGPAGIPARADATGPSDASCGPDEYEGWLVQLDDASARLAADRKSLRSYLALLSYIAFFMIYVTVLFLQRDTMAAFELQQGITDDLELSGYRSVRDPASFYAWVQGGLLDFSYRYTQGRLARYNRVIAGIVVLQYRGILEECPGQEKFRKFYPICITNSLSTESSLVDLSSLTPPQAAIVAAFMRNMGFDAEKSLSDSELSQLLGSSLRASSLPPVGIFYDPSFGAYMSVVLPEVQDRAAVSALFKLQEDLGLVSPLTRRISIKFAVYNGHSRSVGFTTLDFYFSTGGLVRRRLTTDVFRVELYSMPLDKFRLFLEIVVTLCSAFWLAQKVVAVYRRVRHRGRKRRRGAGAGAGPRGNSWMSLVHLADLSLFFVVAAIWVSFVVRCEL
eukprot:tig00001535_g9284.t1